MEAESTTTCESVIASSAQVFVQSGLREEPDNEVPDIHTMTAVDHVPGDVLDLSAPYHVVDH
jgi:hypothetical protein